jgi:Protein of unknown function (DUF3467)
MQVPGSSEKFSKSCLPLCASLSNLGLLAHASAFAVQQAGTSVHFERVKTVSKTNAEGGTAVQNPPLAAPAGDVQQQVKLDESNTIAAYANFARVTGTPEEVIIDFGLNPQPFGPPTEPVVVSQRIIVNFFTAKRLLAALAMTTQRHESAFGVLETDVQKRLSVPGTNPQR